MAVNIQREYNGGDPEAGAEAAAPQGAMQDLMIPGQAVAQIAQFIQAGDCQSVMKLLAEAISAGAQGAPAQ
jgi:hypothetical protein